MCISVSQPVRNIGIEVFAGKAVITRLRHLNTINSVTGKQSEPSKWWMKYFVLPHMGVFGSFVPCVDGLECNAEYEVSLMHT